MKVNVKVILFSLTAVVLFLFPIQQATGLFKFKKLYGAMEEQPKPRLTAQQWLDCSFQDGAEAYLQQHYGFREPLTRLYNQYIWDCYGLTFAKERNWVFVSDDGWYYESSYVQEYYEGNSWKYAQDSLQMANILGREALMLSQTQQILDSMGVHLFVLLEPGKELIYPEHIPTNTQYHHDKVFSAHDFLHQRFEELGIHFIDLIVIDKADGVLSMGVGRGSLNIKILLDQYFAYTKQHCTAHVVHRLDTRTSGVMVYAKTVEVQQMLVNNWHAHVRDRRYVAVVEGTMESDHGHIESWLRDTPSRKVVSSPFNNGGKWASTDWWLLDSNDDYSLIELHLNTGRKNQIRVHMEVLGHPVVGDYKYGSIDASLNRLGLHAFRLAFMHPVTHEELEFETPFPIAFLDLFPEQLV